MKRLAGWTIVDYGALTEEPKVSQDQYSDLFLGKGLSEFDALENAIHALALKGAGVPEALEHELSRANQNIDDRVAEVLDSNEFHDPLLHYVVVKVLYET